MLIANRYELLEKLGQGGMGTVYRAIDTQTQGEFREKCKQYFTPDHAKSQRAKMIKYACILFHK